MEQRRFLTFILVSTLVLFAWLRFGPQFFPAMFPKPAVKPPAGAAAKDEPPPVDAADAEPDADPEAGPPAGDEAEPVPQAAQPAVAAAPADLPELPGFPEREIVLGSMAVDSGFYLKLVLTSTGAAIESATLNDPRFTTAEDRKVQLEVVGNNPGANRRTFATSVAAIDALLQPYRLSLRDVEWEAVDVTANSVTFRYPAPDGSLEVRKTFTLNKGNPADRDGDFVGYLVDVDLEIINHGDQTAQVDYTLQGPVGLPLENADNTREFIDIKVGTAAKPGSPVQYTAKQLVKQTGDAAAQNDPAKIDKWRDPLAYAGVDVQYFAALVVPREDQTQDRDGDGKPDPYFSEVRPDLVTQHPKSPERSDISLLLQSREITLAPGASETDEFRLFLGPKRPKLLEPLHAGGVITFGWFSIVSVWMVYLLDFFHHVLWLPYGLAIVLLTLIVRACMFPVTRRQAIGAKKMKELQPKLQELKAKYSKEPEKFWQAQRELFRKHNYSPLSGCLPLFLQLPIFIGLYSALSYDVDLRMAQFLWVDNLAAPDALFSFGRELPLLGWTHFNLLPLITICLWVVQQKMFMPPAATDEQALQFKVMNYMMIFIGFMIYRVPAGLCVYFITSTLWGISERKLIDYLKIGEKKTTDLEGETTTTPPPSPPEPARGGWLSRLMDAADQARGQSATNGRSDSATGTGVATPKKPRRSPKKRRPRR